MHKTKPTPATQQEALIRLVVSPEDRDAFRIVAAKKGLSMAALARTLVLDAIQRDQDAGDSCRGGGRLATT